LTWLCHGLAKKKGIRVSAWEAAGNHSSLDASLHQEAPWSLTFVMIRAGCLNVVTESRLPPCSEQLLLRPPLRS